jgi:hypothetical protein
MLKKLFIAGLLATVVFLFYVASRPAEYRIERHVDIAAPAGDVFAQINDLKRWRDWSPWEGQDPNMVRSYEGAAQGVGAIYSWSGSKLVGEGHMTILHSVAPFELQILVQVVRPWQSSNTAIFSVTPRGPKACTCQWAMQGTNNFGGKLVGTFIDMGARLGQDFERGLKNLRTVAETAERAHPT